MTSSYQDSGNVVHVRVASLTPAPVEDNKRCVALDLEVVGVYKGVARAGDHVKLVIEQSMLERYTSRPAGSWWIVEQPLEPASEYVALCPAGKLADVLRGSCTVMVAAPHLANLAIVRDAEALDDALVIDRLRATCAIATGIATNYAWQRAGAKALTDIRIYDALLSVVLEPSCSQVARAIMLDATYSLALAHEKPAHIARIARTLFKLLAMPEASTLHDNIVGTWLPNALGLEGGIKPSPPTIIFSGEPKFRADTAKLLAARKDAAKLSAWIK